MSTLEGRDRRALVVVDLQNGVVADAHDLDSVVRTVADLVDRARAADVPVVWVLDDDENHVRGSDAWQLVAGLDPADGEPLVDKRYGDAFEETVLEDTLAGLGVGEIVLVGASTEQCIRCTMHSAVIRGYDVALVQGAHTTVDLTEWGLPTPEVIIGFLDEIAGFGMQWPGRGARSVSPAEVGF